MASYGQSKLACMMYALELDRKLKTAGKKIKSNSGHPGGAYTNLSRNMSPWILGLMRYTILPFITQPAEVGALPTLEAALASTAEGGQYYGPARLYGNEWTFRCCYDCQTCVAYRYFEEVVEFIRTAHRRLLSSIVNILKPNILTDTASNTHIHRKSNSPLRSALTQNFPQAK